MHFAVAFGFALFAASAASGVELDRVRPIDAMLLAELFSIPHDEAETIVADTTMAGRIDDAIDPELRKRLPFGGDVIFYFASDGDLLAWSDKSTTVELGYWEVMGNSNFNEVCVRFGHFGLDSICISPETTGQDWLKQRTDGNPFGLVAGAPVPVPLGSGPIDLAAVAGRLP